MPGLGSPRQELLHLITLILRLCVLPQGAWRWIRTQPPQAAAFPQTWGRAVSIKAKYWGRGQLHPKVCLQKPACFHFQSPQLPSTPLKGKEPQDPITSLMICTKCSLRWGFTQDCSFRGTEVKGTHQRHPSPPWTLKSRTAEFGPHSKCLRAQRIRNTP